MPDFRASLALHNRGGSKGGAKGPWPPPKIVKNLNFPPLFNFKFPRNWKIVFDPRGITKYRSDLPSAHTKLKCIKGNLVR